MILVTGGAGYIGSHTCLELIAAGHQVVVVDDLSNSSAESLKRVEALTGAAIPLIVGSVLDQSLLERTLIEFKCDGVIHFAGKKAVQESWARPVDYFHTNVSGSVTLLRALEATNVRRMIFSSSATVYGAPSYLPLDEAHPCNPESPYARSKLLVEQILQDTAKGSDTWGFGILRYFNPIGAHPSGVIGEDPVGIPNNLMPFLSQVAIGTREKLNIFGNDYPTPDGTGVRDYIHVVDVAQAHVRALEHLARPGCFCVNLGTGRGTSVFELLHQLEAVSGRKIPYAIQPRRDGDIASFHADPARAKTLLGWSAERSIQQMCADSWHWQTRNPTGYKTASDA